MSPSGGLRLWLLGLGRCVAAPALMAAVAVTIAVWPGAAEALQFDRAAVSAGEVWRVVTCHWTHWSLDHLLWDALALVTIGSAAWWYRPRRAWVCVAVSAFAIPLVVAWWHPLLPTYRGLSGIDTALLALLLTAFACDNARQRRWLPVSLAAGVALLLGAKTYYELRTGGAWFVDSHASGMVPVPIAHVAGAAAGVLCGWPRTRNGRAARRRLWRLPVVSGLPGVTSAQHPVEPSGKGTRWSGSAPCS